MVVVINITKYRRPNNAQVLKGGEMTKDKFRKILIKEIGKAKVMPYTGFMDYKEVIKAINNSLRKWADK